MVKDLGFAVVAVISNKNHNYKIKKEKFSKEITTKSSVDVKK